ncbi:MAM and LDL-receptor class A domain-containing protein 2 [Trichonephila inaurata madagascariensis]|uniref:MAM and LDL-receptor class A domain-containing protein 2 n=2 Tax=Trichonephila inaurata madagascariensis TaxID=2747483 RepID=A0A8X6XDU9_9ARAC|nr:MAM and LDL-receptor class A domain-containing protein 2 [Trichonephila inaurata madagascariensis]
MGMLRICFLILALAGVYVSGQGKSYKCTFETGICPFLNNVKDNKENWKIGRGRLNKADTGPSVDHTLGTGLGTYLFVNVSSAKTNPVSLQTVVVKNTFCVRFFYHMYGANIGDLTVQTQSASSPKETVKYFTRSRTQGDRWKEAFFSVMPSGSMKLKGYRVIFTAKHGVASKTRGDIALDDIELIPGKCSNDKDALKLCSFDDSDCGYTATRKDSLQWSWKSESQSKSFWQELVRSDMQPTMDHTLGTEIGGYWYCEGNSASLQTPLLSSPVYKKPKNPMNCLHFYYYIDGDGSSWLWGSVKNAFIQAHLNFPNSKEGRQWLVTRAKNVTYHRQWTYVEAQAKITADFQLQFTAGLETGVNALVALDDVKFLTGNCPETGFCDFEENKCLWKDGVAGEYNWVRKCGSCSTNSEIGPTQDHTLDKAEGNYVVFSTINKQAGAEANLESEFFPPDKKSRCLTFYYSISGKNVGTLKALRREENVTESTLWLMKGDQGNIWKKGQAVLKPSILYSQVVFRGIIGTGKNGFMALDDIRVRSGEQCVLSPPTADPRYDAMDRLTCAFDDKNLCSWKQDTSTLAWKFGNGSLIESTGPKQPMSGKGNYIYISSYEGAQSNNEKIARIVSPVISSFHPDSACFSFYYHMFGAHVGELRVFLVPMQDEKTPLGRQVIWKRRGTQPDKWLQFRDSLNVTEGDYRLEIEAEGGNGFAGDIAIDDIAMNLGACPGVDMCDFESSLCGWKIEPSKKGKFSWQRGVSLNKGPAQDHTTNTKVGYYLQAVADPGAETEEVTYLVSPLYGNRWGPHCLTFWYYRPGLSVGKISILTRIGSKENLQWSATRDVGKFWHYGQVTINEKSAMRVVFQAEKGPKGDYEMAIDDILIQNSKCGETAACNFNNDYCSYFLNETSDFAWLLGTGRVVNTQLVDLPPADNSVENGMYVYADMTLPGIKENQQAVLVSEILEVPTRAVSCLTFYYHKNGKDKSTLSVGKATLYNTDQDMQYKIVELYSTTDNSGKEWMKQMVNVVGSQGTTHQIYFQAVKGNGSRAFIAIDDISVKDGQCQAPTTEPPVTVTEMPVTSISCDFDKGKFCSWKADNTKLKWQINVPSKAKDKMPKVDHTLGNYLGRYAYVQGDNNSPKEGTMTSSDTPSEWKGNFCFSFWYFMNVDGENSLKVNAEHRPRWRYEFVNFWTKQGNFGYRWKHAYVHIKSNKINPKV